MILKIKPELLENDFFTIKGNIHENTEIHYIDFNFTQPVNQTNGFQTIQSTMFHKAFKINNYIDISIPYNYQIMNHMNHINQLLSDINLIKIIKDRITDNFIEKAIELGKINKSSDFENKKYDISVSKIKNSIAVPIHTLPELNNYELSNMIGRKIISKFMMLSNYITKGRIGPAQYFISNSKTYNYILDHIHDTNLVYSKNKQGTNLLNIGGITYQINDKVEEDIIIVGRKNTIEQTGVHCIILTDNEGYIKFDIFTDPISLSTKIRMYYEIIDIGLSPELQYMIIDTRDISYKRYKKLQRIKELYNR